MTARGAKRRMKHGFAGGFAAVAALFLLALFLKNSALASEEVRRALELCTKILIPSLFPLTVISELVTETGALERVTRGISKPVARVLGVAESAAAPYFLGLLGGYTASCKSAILLFRAGRISKRDCESIIALSNMPSLAFLTGFVGTGVFKSSTVGWILWICTVMSTLILGIAQRLLFRKVTDAAIPTLGVPRNRKSISRIFVDAIAHSANAMLLICANVVFFSVLIGVLEPILARFGVGGTAAKILLGALEITRGVSFCSELGGGVGALAACAFFIGWSGLCVHFQVISLSDCDGLSFKRYFILKALQGLICAALAWAVFSILGGG